MLMVYGAAAIKRHLNLAVLVAREPAAPRTRQITSLKPMQQIELPQPKLLSDSITRLDILYLLRHPLFASIQMINKHLIDEALRLAASSLKSFFDKAKLSTK